MKYLFLFIIICSSCSVKKNIQKSRVINDSTAVITTKSVVDNKVDSSTKITEKKSVTVTRTIRYSVDTTIKRAPGDTSTHTYISEVTDITTGDTVFEKKQNSVKQMKKDTLANVAVDVYHDSATNKTVITKKGFSWTMLFIWVVTLMLLILILYIAKKKFLP